MYVYVDFWVAATREAGKRHIPVLVHPLCLYVLRLVASDISS